ncbi:TIM44-like domain-containing protein [Corallococcus sp. bb12-1]|uniref:TIM44-like domain-containing protein n=1 Tax=Corallococcus sp. bb12-1 TaxID=2996784 RepID=UPI002270BB89|nr:TIM44-like domain-containing protein [Corallococcus sp. bb12-1]MCY1041730.1 TIM44-like domain-containing protein [Corallococcus sp. bb12-1]
MPSCPPTKRPWQWSPGLRTVLALLVLALPLVALARGGGGEHYTSGRDRGGGGGGDGLPLWLLFDLVRMIFLYPKVTLPLLLIGGVLYWLYKRNLHPTATTQRALDQREAEVRTQVSGRDVQGWVNALKLKDPSFEIQPTLDKVRWLFLELQKSWFRRDMTPVRPFLSDATWQRFNVQLQLMKAQGVRDALADINVEDVQLIGLHQTNWYDSIHVRVRASIRDTDVPADQTDAQAMAAAKKVAAESFTEVWTFVRKPGAQTRIGEDLFQGKCPNCGAPYKGGASNTCEFCNAVVNSGNYDWTLAEITQGVEHVRHHKQVDGLMQARADDPALNLEMLEDRASLLFWKWIDAQSRNETQRLSKVANAEVITRLSSELEELGKRGRRRVFLECAVGAVDVRALEVHPESFDEAQVELRWSARMGIGPVNERPPSLPTVPQRWVFTLVRRHGAKTNTDTGMSTDRCPQCNAPLTNSGANTCEFCGTVLGNGERDWVLASALPFESWNVRQDQRHSAASARRQQAREETRGAVVAPVDGDRVMTDQKERERLLYMMASIAAADGEVSNAERRLLKLCAERWSVSWANVEMALNAGPQLFERLVPRGSPEAEVFLRHIVEMALVDGRIDRKERKMLEIAAQHLGLEAQLPAMLGDH